MIGELNWVCTYKKKIRNNVEVVGLEVKTKRPGVVRAIINNDKVIFVTQHTNNCRCPKITMY